MKVKDQQKKQRVVAYLIIAVMAVMMSMVIGTDSSSAENIDNSAPVVNIISPMNNAILSGTVAMYSQATDNVGVTRVSYYHSGTSQIGTSYTSPYFIIWNTTGVSDGDYYLVAKAYDAAENEGISPTVNVKVDNTPPTGAVTNPSSGAVIKGMVTLNASASDANGINYVSYYRDGSYYVGLGSTSSGYPYLWNTTGVSNGSHTIKARISDKANNYMFTTDVSVTVDNQAPTVSVTSPTSGAYVKGTIAISADASDNLAIDRVEFYRDGSTLIDTDNSYPYEISLDTTSVSDGAHILTAKAYDTAGNVITSTGVSITIDNQAPSTSVTSPSDGALVKGTVSINADASDNIGVTNVEFYRDGSTLIGQDSSLPFSINLDTTSIFNGAHTLTSKAYDAAGNVITSSAVSIIVDNQTPTVSITSPTNGSSVSGTVAVNANASDNVAVSKVEFYYNGTNFIGDDTSSPYSVNWNTSSLAPGGYTLTAKAYDTVGNVTTSSQINVTVWDSVAPTTNITFPTDGSRVNKKSSVTITANASDNVGVTKVEFYVNGVKKCTDTTSPYSCVWSVPNGAGIQYQLQTKAYDAANNIGNSSIVTVTSQ